MNTLILGLGNPILSDDAVGLIVARQVFERAKALGELQGKVELVEASVAGLNILDIVCGYDKLVVIDSIQTREVPAGTVLRVELEDPTISARLKSPHGIDFALALEMGRRLGAKVPDTIHIYGIEVDDPFTFGEHLTPAVYSAVPTIVDRILAAEFGGENARAFDN